MNDSNMEGIVFNIQRYSIDDGPGIRSTVFLKGCPLRCLWCSNPESWNSLPEVTYRYTSCRKCGRCVQVCPMQAITLDKDGVHIDRERCRNCGRCAKECVAEALKITGKKMTAGEVFAVVNRDIDYYRNSGGGVTVSGGEVLSQPDFTAALLKLCQDAGLHTCVDTSGYGEKEALDRVLAYCNLVYFDLKHMDPIQHKKLTGQSNEVILRNLAVLIDRRIPVVIRVPLIPGYNNSDKNIAAMAQTVADLTKEAPVHLLPYHRYGVSKYKMLGRKYTLEGVKQLTEEELARAQKIVESFGLECMIAR